MDPCSPDASPTLPALVTVAEARRLLGGVSGQTIYRLIADGELPIVKIRRRTFMRCADLEALIESATRSGWERS